MPRLVLGALALLAAQPAAWSQDVHITEVGAANDSVLTDSDGEYPDWIELYNAGTESVELTGWGLTDDPQRPYRWTFPEMSLAAGEFRVVFASGKDRRDPEGELHTNFSLESTGEFVGLVEIGGALVSAYVPSYPEQLPDVSYGFRMNVDATVAVTSGAQARWHVPQDDALGQSWIEPDFDDSTWGAGPLGIGFDQSSTPSLLEFVQTDVGEAMRRVNSSIYVRVPFEVDRTDRSVAMRVQYEDGFVAWLNGVEIARRNGDFPLDWNTRASGRQTDTQASEFEEIRISTQGLLRPGTNVLAVQGLNDSSSGSDFLILPELSLIRVESVDTASPPEYFTTPTPGQPNGEGVSGLASRPAFSTPGRALADPITLELSADEPDAVIRYTTNGTIPDEDSTEYTAPIEIGATVTVKARTFIEGMLPSPTVSETYLLVHASAQSFDTNLPIVILDVQGAMTENAFQDLTLIEIDGAGPGERNSLLDPITLAVKAGVKLHGSSSLGFPKKNLRIETREESRVDRAVPLLGMPAESDYVFHGPYSDKSLMRNGLAYRWAADIGWKAPRTRFCEVYLKTRSGPVTSSDYWGVYLCVERIKRDVNRVDVRKLLPTHDAEPEITGGYIFKKDRLDPGDAGFTTSRGQRLAFVEPEEREVTPTQRTWVTNWFRQFETALYGANFADPEQGYAKYIDVDSWIDHHIVVEACKQIDGYRLSTYMYKDRGGKLFMGPIWDYNLSLGNADYLQGWIPQNWYYPQLGSADYPWYPRLFQDAAFRQKYEARWIELRGYWMTTHRLQGTVDETVDLIGEAAGRNFQKWRILGTRIWPNWFIARTWDEEVDWMSRTWLPARLAWFDSQWGIHAPELSYAGGPVEEGFELGVITRTGVSWYTTDGEDPRAPDGTVSPTAVRYTQPIPITDNTLVRVRSHFGAEGWTDVIEGSYVTDPLPLVVTEIMYNPLDDETDTYRTSELEYIEFQNIGDEEISVAGVTLVNARFSFEFPESGPMSTLPPGGFALAVGSQEAFEFRYGTDLPVAGVFDGTLSNARMDFQLYGPLGEPLLDFVYEDWYESTDGDGYSLVIVDPTASRSSWSDMESWRPSEEIHGSPGAPDSVLAAGLQRPGDFHQDGRLDISDAVGLLSYIFRGQGAAPCTTPAGYTTLLDVSGDGAVQLTDAVVLLQYLFADGAAPVLGAECVEIEGCPDACTSTR